MINKKILFAIIIVIWGVNFLNAQPRDVRLRTKGYINPQEVVSIDSSMRFEDALRVLNEKSKEFAGKVIIDLEKRRQPIGVIILNQHWRDALELILSRHGLWYDEEADFIRITSGRVPVSVPPESAPPGVVVELPPTLDSRDVKISAVFFTTNVEKLHQYGIAWDFFRTKRKEPHITGYASIGRDIGDTLVSIPGYGVRGLTSTAFAVIKSPPEFKFANIDALIKFFGTNQLGEVLTSPEVIVRDGKKGKIQVGRDIFVTSRDIAGNTINERVATGTIIEVTPIIYTENDTDFIYLNLEIEQSDARGNEIARALVKTHALLFDGEETVIGGLYTTVESEARSGVPFLKDLPWWFFGLRYIFGSDEIVKTKQELIILLKAEIVEPIRTRILNREQVRDVIKEKRSEYQQEYDKK